MHYSFFVQTKVNAQQTVSQETMQSVYDEIKAPYKYGLVMVGADKDKKTDCPTIFHKGGMWYMYYFVFGGRGYEQGDLSIGMATSDD